ncbi:MAG: NYN domain-containing protein [Planctomycetia bacterium]
MTLIIDGYNLLHASGVFGAERGPRGFEQSRIALLDLLLDLLGDDASKTIVVFDAARAPDGLPGRCTHGPIRVWYAREYPDADSLIEELVEDDDAPQDLVVVSGDRRLQAAARRRRATAVGSEEWLAERRAHRQARRNRPDAKPPEPGPDDVERWKRYFGFS